MSQDVASWHISSFRRRAAPWSLSEGLCCKTPLLLSSGPICVLLSLWRSALRASYGIIGLRAWQTGYAVQVTAADGGGRQRNLTRRRRF